jgi:hypothetical protein
MQVVQRNAASFLAEDASYHIDALKSAEHTKLSIEHFFDIYIFAS